MTLSQSLVEIKTITCDRACSEFDEQKIEQAAKSIIAAEGIINPILVARIGINSFKVVNGDFEYYAAVRAKEIDLAKGETIAAYIVDEDDETIKQQIDIFRKSQIPSISPDRFLETRITNIESRFENRLNELKEEYTNKIKDLENNIVFINRKLPAKIEPLSTFNQAKLPELITKLERALGNKKTNQNFAEQIIAGRPFKSLSDVKEKTKGLGEKTMLKIIDCWLNYNNF